ncbi:hypothetical protein AFK68_06595, partial [Hydrocoleum sp. CS-953]
MLLSQISMKKTIVLRFINTEEHYLITKPLIINYPFKRRGFKPLKINYQSSIIHYPLSMLSNINSVNPWLVAIILNTILLSLVYFAPKKLLTPAGIVHAWILGVLIWGSLGWPGY